MITVTQLSLTLFSLTLSSLFLLPTQGFDTICGGTLYPTLCISTLSKNLQNHSTKSIPDAISATVNVVIKEVKKTHSNCSGLRRKIQHKLGRVPNLALTDCLELFDDTVSNLKVAVEDLSNRTSSPRTINDLQTLLSTAITNQYTCLDGFAFAGESVRKIIEKRLIKITRHVSNSLVMLKKLENCYGNNSKSSEFFFPAWISVRETEILQASSSKYDAVVAKDGSGDYTTVGAALAAAPNGSDTRYVIYIKAGAYLENVEVVSKKTNLMFIGDGIGKTVIKGSRSVGTNWTTFRSATVAVVGDGFLAKGITIENSAGASNHQAVALRSDSDLSAFFNCSFVGYQDTLYTRSMRQFFRNCDIYGTIDFVFGNSAVVLQNCNLYARKPDPKQKNIFTAQGREDPNQNTGISLINCKFAAAADLIPVQSTFKSYLGRPWGEYSRTVVLVSEIDGLIDPAGWLEWDGDHALKTLFYGEYMNRGPGANTSARVTWEGYRVINKSSEANAFSAGVFIEGGVWLPATGIPNFLGLS